MSVYKGLKYYKYVDWTQPVIASDTAYGTLTSSITTWNDGQVWHISDGVKGTSNKWGGNSGSGNIIWQMYEKIKINSFQVWQTNETNYLNRFPKTIKLYASDDGINYTEVGSLSEYSQPASAGYVTVTCNTSRVYEYYKWEFGTSWKGSEIAVSEIVITAQKAVEYPSYDYDYTEPQKISEIYRGLKYYKYESWTQPALSSNTTTVTEGNIVVSASSNYSGEDPWRALDGNNSGTSFAFNSVPTGWWQVKFPYKLRITGLTFCQRENAGSYRTNTARFYTSSDKSTPIGNEFNPPATSYAQTVVSGIPSAGIITDTIYLDVTAGLTSAGMSELYITAQKVVAGTSSSYDYSEPQKIAKIYKGLNYYKYQSWTQPTLTANGIVGGSSFAAYASSEYNSGSLAYFAFNSGSSQYWHSNSGHPQWIGWYNPNPLHITNIKVKNRNSDGSYIKDYTVLCSNDNDNFIEVASGTSPNQSAYAEWNIAISETNSYKYWRLNCLSSSGSNGSYTAVQYITITATEMVAGTSSDYDYAEPILIYSI